MVVQVQKENGQSSLPVPSWMTSVNCELLCWYQTEVKDGGLYRLEDEYWDHTVD